MARPASLTLRRYRRFGAGGAKLIWGEACAVVPAGRANPRQLLIEDSTAPALDELLQLCRRAHVEACGTDNDLLIGLQLTHSGRYSSQRPLLAQHDPLLDPRTVIDRSSGQTATAAYPLISDDELDRLQDRYLAAADLAYRIGFDFVDLKQCHRYLLNELLAARNRPGKYGGSLENRTRFIHDLVGRLRDAHPGKLIATRLNVFDGIPYQKGPQGAGVPVNFTLPMTSCWGTREDNPFEPDLTEPLVLIKMLINQGLDLLNVSMGNPYASPHLIRPFEYPPPDGYETPEHPLRGVDRHFRLTGEIQRAFPDLAVVGSGYSWLQAFAFQAGAANVQDGAHDSGRNGACRAGSARIRPARDAGRAPRSQTPLPDLQLLHRAHAVQAQRTRAVPHRLPSVRQGGLRAHLGRGPTMSRSSPRKDGRMNAGRTARYALSVLRRACLQMLVLSVIALNLLALIGFFVRDRSRWVALLLYLPLLPVGLASITLVVAFRRPASRSGRAIVLALGLISISASGTWMIGWRHPVRPRPEDRRLRLLHWNVWWGGMAVEKTRPWKDIGQEIVDRKPDLIVLSEAPFTVPLYRKLDELPGRHFGLSVLNFGNPKHFYHMFVAAKWPVHLERKLEYLRRRGRTGSPGPPHPAHPDPGCGWRQHGDATADANAPRPGRDLHPGRRRWGSC